MATHKMSHSFILSCSCLLHRFEHTYVLQQHAGEVHVGLLPVERTVVVVVLVLVLVVAAVVLVAV